MSQITVTILIIALTAMVIFFGSKLINRVLNLKAHRRRKYISDISSFKHGLIFNPDSKKVEADQSVITTF